jgi:nickel-dependent lactate racemase
VEIISALEKPINSPRIKEIAKSGNKVAIVVDDATRKTPSYLMVPPILNELNEAGVKDSDVTVIFGCGTHRPVSGEEAKKLLGEEVLSRVKTVSHDCNAEDLVEMGVTSFKTQVFLNKTFAEADVKILTGDINLHYYAGYGGGRKSVVPGVSGTRTIQHNHALMLDPNSKIGSLEKNPVHMDMTEVARLANVNFILNVVLNEKNEVVKAFAGDLEAAFLEGVKQIDEMYKVPVSTQADIIVVSPGGHPFDADLFHATKPLEHVIDIVRDNGVIILVAECSEGHGNIKFYEWMTKFRTLDEVKSEIKRNFVLGGHKAYYLLREMQKARIIAVSALPEYMATGVFRLKTAKNVNEALEMAFRFVGRRAKILVVPYGTLTLPILKISEISSQSINPE